MKKLLSILLAVALLATLAGCGGNEAPDASDPAESTTTTTGEDTTTTTEEDDATTTESEDETTTAEEEDTTAEEETTTTTEEEVTTTTEEEAVTTTGTRGTLAVGSIPAGLATMKGTTTTFQKYEASTTTTTEATTTTTKAALVAEPVMDTPYVCWIQGGTDLIRATATFTAEGCVITRTFYTCNPENAVYGTDVETMEYENQTYYRTGYVPQAAARYEIVGITIDVFNEDGSIAKTFSMPTSDSMECSFSDGIAFGRQRVFDLEEK